MKTSELERMLFDPEALKTLVNRAEAIKQKYGQQPLEAVGKIHTVELLPNAIKPTPEEIKANDFDWNERRRPLLATISLVCPELAKEDPKKILSILTERCRKEPTEVNLSLVEDAINRITTVGEPDADSEKLIAESIDSLAYTTKTEETKRKQEKERGTDAVWSRLYQHSDYRGRSVLTWHSPGCVYRQFRSSWLNDARMHDNISSLYVDASSSEIGGYVVLFQHDRFQGRYALYTTTPGNPTVPNYIPYVGGFINDKTSSILVIRRFDNELPPVALGNYGEIRDVIEDLVDSVDRVSMRGDAIITWDMWPEGPTSGSDPHPDDSKRFIYIKVPIKVDVPNWFDYDADIRYWIYPWVDSGGTLRAHVAHYGAWVEGGTKHDAILDRVIDALPGTVGTVNAELTNISFH